jgi:cytoskeleton protein RodZ
MDDFGGKLRQARERRGISLRQIAASTKISAAALEALERNDISKLPGGIFSRAFVRSYAVEVGLDPDDTVREFLDRFNQEAAPTAETAAATIPPEEVEFETRRKRAELVLLGAVISIPLLIALGYFGWRWRSAAKEPPASATAGTVAPAPVPAPASAPEASPPPAADSSAPSGTIAGQLVLELHPTATCYVSLTVDGRNLFAREMRAGERVTQQVLREAVIKVGDAGAFAFAVNGREGKPLGDKGQVRTLTLTPATAAQYLR